MGASYQLTSTIPHLLLETIWIFLTLWYYEIYWSDKPVSSQEQSLDIYIWKKNLKN